MTAARHVSPKALAMGLAIAALVSSPLASADPISKDQCVDAHSRGQDARDAGKLSLARKLFLAPPERTARSRTNCGFHHPGR